MKKQKEIFAGLNICLTGSLVSMSRPRAKELIENNGGHFNPMLPTRRISSYVGAEPGSKLQKAKELKIEIWNEAAFLKKIGK